MKNFFFFVILIAGGFYFYKEDPANLFGPKFPSVYSTYKEFADHLAYARFDQAREFVKSHSINKIIDKKQGQKSFSINFGFDDYVVHGTKYELKIEDEYEDGDVGFEVRQIVHLGSPSRGTWDNKYDHKVILSEKDDGWKVIDFMEVKVSKDEEE